MDEIQKKVWNELFLAPSVVLPIVAGASAWLFSWGLGGISSLNLAGLVGVLGGFGWMATRMIFQLDSITERTQRFALEKLQKAEEARIEQLAAKLTQGRDARAIDYLTLLREYRREFEEIAELPAVRAQVLQVLPRFRQLFWAALEQLDQSDKLLSLSRKLFSDQQQSVLDQRDHVLEDVESALNRLQSAVGHFRTMSLRADNHDLLNLQEELDVSLTVAKRAEERMREFEKHNSLDTRLKELN
jgi:hypothetical protein